MSKRIALFCCGLLLALGVAAAAQDKPNFTGKWVMDASKSDFGPMPPPESLVQEMDHKEPNLKIKVTQKGQQGERTSEASYTTDGAENENTLFGSAKMKSTTKWDGAKLVTVGKLDFQGNEVELKDTLELGEDAKVLTLTRDIKSPQGEFTLKMVLNKESKEAAK
jgi:hypothetical protein